MNLGLQRIAAYIGSSRIERSLQFFLERQHAIRIIPMTTFRHITRACMVSLVVMDLNDPSTDVTDSLLEIRSRWPSVPIVGYAPPVRGPTLMSSLPDMVSAGMTVVSGWQPDAFADAITRVLEPLNAESHLVWRFERELHALASPRVAAFCRACLSKPLGAATVEQVSQYIGGSRQHVAAEFQRLGMGLPGEFVTLARLGHAVDHVAVTNDGWSDASAALGWSSPEALRRSLQRHAGLSAAAGMSVQGQRHVYELIRRFLRAAG